jgi:hypothetical protein
MDTNLTGQSQEADGNGFCPASSLKSSAFSLAFHSRPFVFIRGSTGRFCSGLVALGDFSRLLAAGQICSPRRVQVTHLTCTACGRSHDASVPQNVSICCGNGNVRFDESIVLFNTGAGVKYLECFGG